MELFIFNTINVRLGSSQCLGFILFPALGLGSGSNRCTAAPAAGRFLEAFAFAATAVVGGVAAEAAARDALAATSQGSSARSMTSSASPFVGRPRAASEIGPRREGRGTKWNDERSGT